MTVAAAFSPSRELERCEGLPYHRPRMSSSRPIPIPASTRRESRWILLGLVLALTLAPVFALVHCVFEAHEYCADHGTLEHGDHHDDGAPHDDSEESHDPCEILPAVRGESTAPADSIGLARPVEFAAVFAAALSTAPPAAIPVLRFAPKTSPPPSLVI
jgi:hypothetical protein